MNESKIVGRLLFPTYQEPAGSVGPGMRGFDNPASGFLSGAAAALFLTTTTDVRNVSETFRRRGRAFSKVPFVETQMLPRAVGRGVEWVWIEACLAADVGRERWHRQSRRPEERRGRQSIPIV